ncbi:hypothetical protein BaRGS_00016243 [Batillaria attramentaria]|uniref:Uncharacterized protein n=1 Tax=Batillaria attramentaria TaxID=370345 RepID=A0ABD0KZI8_9CAEN
MQPVQLCAPSDLKQYLNGLYNHTNCKKPSYTHRRTALSIKVNSSHRRAVVCVTALQVCCQELVTEKPNHRDRLAQILRCKGEAYKLAGNQTRASNIWALLPAPHMPVLRYGCLCNINKLLKRVSSYLLFLQRNPRRLSNLIRCYDRAAQDLCVS